MKEKGGIMKEVSFKTYYQYRSVMFILISIFLIVLFACNAIATPIRYKIVNVYNPVDNIDSWCYGSDPLGNPWYGSIYIEDTPSRAEFWIDSVGNFDGGHIDYDIVSSDIHSSAVSYHGDWGYLELLVGPYWTNYSMIGNADFEGFESDMNGVIFVGADQDYEGYLTLSDHIILGTVYYDVPVGHPWCGFGTYFTLQRYVQPVPEPTTMLLLGAGLVGLAGLKKKFKN